MVIEEQPGESRVAAYQHRPGMSHHGWSALGRATSSVVVRGPVFLIHLPLITKRRAGPGQDFGVG